MAEDDARAYIFAFEHDPTQAAEIAQQTSTKLQQGDVKLLEVIKALGDYLQDNDSKIRGRAIHYLAAILQTLPAKSLSRHDIPVLNTFLCSRLQDGGAVEALSILCRMDKYTKDNAKEVAQAMFEQFADMSDAKQSERYQVYLLLNELLSYHRTALLEMGNTSLLGYVKVVGGEKDPRNLMLIFSMLRVLMIEWDISQHIDVMFDSVYAYFPITFRPPPNDPYGITAQDLKDRLKECLASTGELAPSVFPNLLDRLDSTSEAVKKDVLQALAACAINYDPVTIANYSITLWDAVKYEVLQAQEPFLADEALIVLGNVAACLSRKVSPHAPDWKADHLLQYLKPVNKESLEHLKEPASRQAGASADILKSVASATTRSFEIILKGVGPSLLTLQQSAEGINNQRAILMVVNKLFEASIEVYGNVIENSQKNFDNQQTLLLEFKDRLLALYSRALMSTVKEEVSYRLVALRGLLLLAEQRNMLEDSETGLIVQHLNEVVLDEESYSRDELKQKAMQALAEISKSRPRLITDITFPKFIARLPEDENKASEDQEYHAVLEGLAQISTGQDLLDTLMRRLLNKIDLLTNSERRDQYPYLVAILSTINYILERSAKEQPTSLDQYFDRIVVNLSRRAASVEQGPLTDVTVLAILGKTINVVVRNSSPDHQMQVAINIYTLWAETGQPNSVVVEQPVRNTMILSMWLLAALPRTVNQGILSEPVCPLISKLLTSAILLAEQKQSAVLEQSVLRQITILANKYITTPGDISNLNSIVEDLVRKIQNDESSLAEHNSQNWHCTVRCLFSVVRALVLRLATTTTTNLTALVDLLGCLPTEHARYIALGFGSLLSEDEVISTTNHAQIRLLAPQRTFQTLMPMFSSKFKDSNVAQSHKEVYLIALSGVLGTISSSIVMPELPQLLPLLLQSLEIADANENVRTATLNTLTVVITKNPDALIESGQLNALARRLITVATSQRSSNNNIKKVESDTIMRDVSAPISRASASSKTRRLALHCLTLLPQHIKDAKPPNPLLNLKREVLDGLARCLDDSRREVRKEAVDARARWLRNVDDVDESDEE